MSELVKRVQVYMMVYIAHTYHVELTLASHLGSPMTFRISGPRGQESLLCNRRECVLVRVNTQCSE